VFHCLVPAKVGGETILFDGFYAAEKLKQNYPEYFEILSKVPIEHHYLEGMSDRFENASVKLYSRSIAPVITCFNGKIVQVRLNPYDRAPFRTLNFSPNSEKTALETVKFYEAYEKFSQLCNAPEAAIKIALKPGTVIFIDNYRVFHSRTEFQGSRKMCGCYLSRDNFLAKVRPLLKIDDL
uniref:TauD/TfdA-like domain-containing protein n=1 Tax=Acrobeloides nanus TaxID=290746 RepID=A0A914CN12_9BILA